IEIKAGDNLSSIHKDAIDHEMNFRYEGSNVLISIDETTSIEDVKEIVHIFARIVAKNQNEINFSKDIQHSLGNDNIRKSEILTHPIFNSHHSEHEMLRYIKSLESKDLSLCHSMIALGSCTMKLNATTETVPLTWPEFRRIHPLAPTDQAGGPVQLIAELDERV